MRFLSSRRRNGLPFPTVRNADSALFMPSLRGTRHDSAKIDGGGSNPPGGTRCLHFLRAEGVGLPIHKPSADHLPGHSYVEVWRPDRTPNPIGLGSIPRRRASSVLRRGPPCGVIAAGVISGLSTRHFLAIAFTRDSYTAGCSSGEERSVRDREAGGSIPLTPTHRQLTLGASILCHFLPGTGPSMEGDRFDSKSMRDT